MIVGLVDKESFFEIQVDCPIEFCAWPDQKGIYEKAKAEIIQNFTGISAPYELPENPEMVIKSEKVNAINTANEVLELMRKTKSSIVDLCPMCSKKGLKIFVDRHRWQYMMRYVGIRL